MRKLKHIMLFEAFDSKLLSKTLSFLSKESKQDMLKTLEIILGMIDDGKGGKVSAPQSLLKDEFFSYLPYEKAVELKYEGDVDDCAACQGTGYVKKAYGRGFRNVACAACGGSGKGKPEKKLKYFKFWINTDGKLVETTLCDGEYRADKSDIGNYDKVADITEDAKNLSGTTIKAKHATVNGETELLLEGIKRYQYRDREAQARGLAFVDSNGKFNMVNNSFGIGPEPSGRKWKTYGVHSIDLRYALTRDFNSEARLFIIKQKEIKKDIFWNSNFTLSRGIINPTRIKEKDLADAHAAIVFDYGKFREWFLSSGMKDKGAITAGREEAKKGSYAMMKPEDIKSANIERYIKSVSNIDLAQGMTRLLNKIPGILGGDRAIYFAYNDLNTRSIKHIISLVYMSMRATGEIEMEEINSKISEELMEVQEKTRQISKKINERLEYGAKIEGDAAALLKEIEGLSKAINAKMREKKLECIEDIEKFLMLSEFAKNLLTSGRIGINSRVTRYLSRIVVDWESNTSVLMNITGLTQQEIQDEIWKIGQIKKTIERF